MAGRGGLTSQPFSSQRSRSEYCLLPPIFVDRLTTAMKASDANSPAYSLRTCGDTTTIVLLAKLAAHDLRGALDATADGFQATHEFGLAFSHSAEKLTNTEE